MTKQEKLRHVIRDEVKRGFMHELQKVLNQNRVYVKKIKQYPDFIESIIDELVEKQLPYYDRISAETVDAAYAFFIETAAGDEWVRTCTAFNTEINSWVGEFTMSIVRRLDALEIN